MNHRKRLFAFAFLLSTFLLTGCQKTEVPLTISSDLRNVTSSVPETAVQKFVSTELSEIPIKLIHFPTTYVDTDNELVQFQAVVKTPENMPEEIYTDLIVSYISLDFDQAMDLLMPARIDKNSLTKEVRPDIEEAFPFYTAFNDQIELSNSYYTFYLQTDKWKLLRYAIFSDASAFEFNMPLYETRQEFSFGTAEEVFDDLTDKMKTLGLHTELHCTAFYADSDTLTEQYIPMEIATQADGTPVTFDAEDSGYYFSAVQVIEKLPVYACYYYGSGIEGGLEAANLLAYIDSDGLEMLRAERIIDTITYSEKKGILLPLDRIADVIKNRFAIIITNNKVVMTELRLCYMTQPIDKYQLRLLPVWLCNYDLTDQNGNCFQQQILINAVTGEEVIYAL